MNSLPEPSFFGNALPDAEANVTQRLDDYLDYLCVPLVGIVPYQARHDFCAESRSHLEALMAEYRELGMTPREALETALREFGDPWKLGRAFLREWVKAASSRTRRTQTPAACAFAWFGAATVINLLMFEWWACVVPYEYQEWSGRPYDLFTVAAITPLVAGLLTGLTQPYPDGKAMLRVQAVLLLFTLLLGLTQLPHVNVLHLAAWQALWWLPAGYFTTVTIATTAQNLRRLRFWRRAASRRPAL